MAITQLLHRAAQTAPTALATTDGVRELTYRALRDRAALVAGALRGLDVERGDRVGVLASNSTEVVELILGAAWAGAVISPVNTRWSTGEIAYQLRDAGIRVLFVDAARTGVVAELGSRFPDLRVVVMPSLHRDAGPAVADAHEYAALLASASAVPDLRSPDDDLAVLMYTGGTSGVPKGVMLSHRQLLSSALGALASSGLSNRPAVVLHAGPLFHMSAFGGLLQHLAICSTHVLPGDAPVDRLPEIIERHRVTALSLVPTTIAWLLDEAEQRGRDISSLRQLSYGGAPMPEALQARLLDRLPKCRLRQGYGMTELAPVATVLRDEDLRDPAHPTRRLSVGRAALHVELRIVDAGGNDAPTGETGEVLVRGDNVMMGYWNKPEATEQALRGGWMHTGDLGYLDDAGYLFLVDRLKDMIISGGENVYSAEVERALSQHPSVRQCAVIGVPDTTWGQRVHAIVVLEADSEVSVEELRTFTSGLIAGYKTPKTVEFVSDLPVSSVGKVLKRVLRESHRAADPAP